MVVRILVLALLAAGPALDAFANSRLPLLRVGTCQRDITPVSPSLADAYQAKFGAAAEVNHTDPVYMAGFGTGREATGYNDRLWARGVVVENRGVRVALVQLDVVGYFVNEVETIRAMVGPAIDYVLVGSSHQHEGPDTVGLWGPDDLTSGIDFGYLDFVNAAVADCLDEALANRRFARMYVAEGDAAGLSLGIDDEDDGFGVADGKVLAGDEALAPDTQGRIVDSRLGAIQFTTLRYPFRPIATLLNFASHPESLGSNNTLITSDFPHYVRERLEAEYGGLAIWFSGDLGVLQGPLDIDVLDPETDAPAVRRSFRFAEVHGTQLAERAIEAIDAARYRVFDHPWFGRFRIPRPGNPLASVSFSQVSPVPVRLDNPFFRLFTATGVLSVRRSLFTDGVPDASVGFPFAPPFDSIPQSLGEDLHTEVGLVRIGSAQLAAIPGELDPQIGENYRAALEANGARHTFLLGLTPDEIGYQVPEAKWDDSCHTCFLFVLGGVPQACPVQPIDCNTVFINNAGRDVDPAISSAVQAAIEALD